MQNKITIIYSQSNARFRIAGNKIFFFLETRNKINCQVNDKMVMSILCSNGEVEDLQEKGNHKPGPEWFTAQLQLGKSAKEPQLTAQFFLPFFLHFCPLFFATMHFAGDIDLSCPVSFYSAEFRFSVASNLQPSIWNYELSNTDSGLSR